MKPSDGQNEMDSIIAQGDRGYILQPYDLLLHSEGKGEGQGQGEVGGWGRGSMRRKSGLGKD